MHENALAYFNGDSFSVESSFHMEINTYYLPRYLPSLLFCNWIQKKITEHALVHQFLGQPFLIGLQQRADNYSCIITESTIIDFWFCFTRTC